MWCPLTPAHARVLKAVSADNPLHHCGGRLSPFSEHTNPPMACHCRQPLLVQCAALCSELRTWMHNLALPMQLSPAFGCSMPPHSAARCVCSVAGCPQLNALDSGTRWEVGPKTHVLCWETCKLDEWLSTGVRAVVRPSSALDLLTPLLLPCRGPCTCTCY